MRCVVVALLLAACVDTGPGPAPRVDPKYARAHVLETAPADLDKFDVAVGDKLIYLGNKIDRPRLAPGQSLTIKHYWKVVKPIGKGWRPFALVRGPAGTADFMNLEPTDMQVAYPVERWKAGDIIEDEQPITMRPDWASPYAFVYVGLIEVGRHGTLDRMPVTGARTQDRAIVAAKLELDLSRAPPPVGTIHIPRASGPITIDGMQIDQAWTTAITSPEFVTADGSPDPNGKATAKMTWDDQFLYLFVSVVDSDVTSPYKTHDDSLWKADAIEIFVDADGNRAGYIEVQVNPHNATFDSWFAGPRGPAGDVSWSSDMVTAVKVRGTADGGDTDQGWDVEIGIPWAAIKGRDDRMPVTIPPRIGDRWKLNVVRVDFKSGSDRPSATSWNRIGYSDWHALDKMLTAVFADPTGSTVPTPENTNQPGIAPTQGSGAGVGSAMTPGVGSGSPGGGSATPPRGAGSAAPPAAGSATKPGGGSATTPGSGSGSATKPGGSGVATPTTGTPSASSGSAGGSAGGGSAGTGGGKGGGTGRGPAGAASGGSANGSSGSGSAASGSSARSGSASSGSASGSTASGGISARGGSASSSSASGSSARGSSASGSGAAGSQQR